MTIARGSFIDTGPFIFWIAFFIIISVCVLLFFFAIGLLVLVVKKFKN